MPIKKISIMNYLIDTNCLIYYYNDKQQHFCDWLDKLNESQIYISNLVVFELLSGFYTLNSHKGALFVERLCEIYQLAENYSLAQATLSAMNQVELRKLGVQINSLDLHIASQAIDRNLTLVTFNQKDFEPLKQFGLKLKCFEFEAET